VNCNIPDHAIATTVTINFKIPYFISTREINHRDGDREPGWIEKTVAREEQRFDQNTRSPLASFQARLSERHKRFFKGFRSEGVEEAWRIRVHSYNRMRDP
jgi:hypothetical protein